ncbi:MAG: hypothetical protein ACXVEW_06405 [Solirubrobacteraceae bacterium]
MGASTVWTGREMIVWGGVTRSARGQAAPRSDGAAYNPATRKWRRIASAPSGVVGGGGPAAAWTGRQMVVWASNSPDGPTGGGLYDPRSNTWRRLAKGPLGVREQYASVWTGSELLIFGGHGGDTFATPTAAALDPRTGAWRRLKALDSIIGLGTVNGALWNGREAFVSGILYRPHVVDRAILLAFNPKSGKLRQIDLSKAPVTPRQRRQLDPVGMSGSELVFWAGGPSSSPVVRYNPTSDRWKRAAAAPCRPYRQIAWAGARLIVACATDRLESYNPRTNSWNAMKPGPSPLNSRTSSEIAWTGSDLIVWSGVAAVRYNPTPDDGKSLAAPARSFP